MEGFNKDELEAPEWMNAEFFAKVLRQCENDSDIQVESFELSPATMKGDHYASIMFRAGVKYQQRRQPKTKSLIIKTMPEVEGHKKEMLGDSHIFETEIGMYTEVMPRFERILQAANDDTVLAAPCLYHSLSPRKIIIFEDLVPQGYTVLRDRQPNMFEAKGAFRKLAKWHAVSYKLALEEPKFFDKYCHGLMTIPNMMEDEFMTGGIRLFIDMLDAESSLHQYKSYFEDMAENLLEKCARTFQEYRENPRPGSAYVLCHGDFHYKNMMFKSNLDSGKFEDVMLLDYQISYIGPIVNDVIYAIYMLLDPEQRAHYWDELIYYYFSNFVETLKKIGFAGRLPQLSEFRADLLRHRHLEMFLLVTFLPMWYDMRSGEADPETMLTSADYRKGLYKSPEYIAEVKTILPRYLHLGYFDKV